MARGYSNIKFEWNYSSSVILQNLGFGRDLNREAAEIFERWYQPYVPYKDGDLSTNIRIWANENHSTITHLVRYAHHQYTGDGSDPSTGSPGYDEKWQRTRTVHPLATSYWDQAAWTLHKASITAEIDEARKKYSSLRRGHR